MGRRRAAWAPAGRPQEAVRAGCMAGVRLSARCEWGREGRQGVAVAPVPFEVCAGMPAGTPMRLIAFKRFRPVLSGCHTTI